MLPRAPFVASRLHAHSLSCREGAKSLSAAALSLSSLLLTVGIDAAPEDWTTFRRNTARTGSDGNSELPRKPKVAWTFECDDCEKPSFDASPAIVDGRVYTGLADLSAFFSGGRVVCLDAKSGARLWEKKTEHPVFSSPTIADGRVFIGEGYHQNTDCRLYCLDAKSGEVQWTFQTKSHVESTPSVEGGRVWFGAGADGLYCVDAATGDEVWHYAGAHIDISPLVSSGLVFSGTGYDGSAVLCLSAADGKVKWRTPVDLPAWGSPTRVGNRVFYGLGRGTLARSDENPAGAVICLTATSGKQIWTTSLPDAVLTAVAYQNRKLFVGCRDGNLYCLDPRNGETQWKCTLESAVVSSPTLDEKHVSVVSASGKVAVARIDSGEVVGRFDVGRADSAAGSKEAPRVISSPALAGGLWVLGSGPRLLALREREADGGSVVEETPAKKTPATRLVVDARAGRIRIEGRVAKQGVYEQLKGAIEYVLVAEGGKDYETLFTTGATAERLLEAFEALQVPAGSPAEDDEPARGVPFRIQVEYEADGASVTRAIGEFIRHRKTGKRLEAAPWIYTGSRRSRDPATGKDELQAIRSKNLVGLHHTDASPLLQNSRDEAVSENTYEHDPETLPPAGTPVRIVFEQILPPDGTKRLHVFLSGRVQGVGFRNFTERQARRLKLTGFVRNLSDGRVEALIEGPSADVDKLLAKIRRGPRSARVTKVDSKELQALGDYSSFDVTLENGRKRR